MASSYVEVDSAVKAATEKIKKFSELPIFEKAFSHPDLLDAKKFLYEHDQTEDIRDLFNKWIFTDLPKQITSVSVDFVSKGKNLTIRFDHVKCLPPTYIDYDGRELPLFPVHAQNMKLHYLFTVRTTAIVYATGTDTIVEIGNVLEFKAPCMVRTAVCNTYKLNEEELAMYGENPDDPGGYFIYNGNINVIPAVEKARLSIPIIHRGIKKFPYLHVRQTVNVPSGTAVLKVVEKQIDDGGFVKTCHFTVSRMGRPPVGTKKYKEFNSINIFCMIDIIARVFGRHDIVEETGAEYGKKMIESLICHEDPVTRLNCKKAVMKEMSGTLTEYYYDQSSVQALSKLIQWLEVEKVDNVTKRAKLVKFLREDFFPTIPIVEIPETGYEYVTVGKKRVKRKVEKNKYMIEDKIRMLCYLGYHYYVYKAGYEPLTNKDSWATKKFDTAHISLSQQFWKAWRSYFEPQNTKRVITSAVDFLNHIKPRTITNHLLAPFNSHTDEGTTGTAFEPSQVVNPTSLRELITAVIKGIVKVDKTVRSLAVREIQVHMEGLFCMAQTPDGIKCGLVKTKAIFCRYSLNVAVGASIAASLKYGLISSVETESQQHAVIFNEAIVGWCEGRSTYERFLELRNKVPGAYTFIREYPEIAITSKTSKALLERLAEYREENDEAFDDTFSETYPTKITVNKKVVAYTIDSIPGSILDKKDIVVQKRDSLYVKSKWYPKETREWLYTLLSRNFDEEEYSKTSSPERSVLIYLDGKRFLFCTQEAALRLSNEASIPPLPGKTCIVFNHLGHLCVYTDAGRPTRMMYCVQNRPNKKSVLLVDKIDTTDLTFSEMQERGFATFIDPCEDAVDVFLTAKDKAEFYEKLEGEEEDRNDLEAALADLQTMDPESIKYSIENNRIRNLERLVNLYEVQKIRYVGLHAIQIYGPSAASSPYSAYDPAAKTTGSAKINMQAIEQRSNAYLHRKGYYSSESLLPITVPSITSMFGARRTLNEKSTSFVFMDLKNNEEDALVLNKRLIDSEMLTYVSNSVISAEINIGEGGAKTYLGRPTDAVLPSKQHLYAHLNEYGLPPIGYDLKPGDVAIGLVEYKKNLLDDSMKAIDHSIRTDSKEYGRVKDIIIRRLPEKKDQDTVSNTIVVSILLESSKRPIRGDKFSLQYGQKSVVGAIYDNDDLPFCMNGNGGDVPMIIFNTHAMKGRMTIGVAVECIFGIRGAQLGSTFDSTAFTTGSFGKILDVMEESGYKLGRKNYMNTMTGQMIVGYESIGFLNIQQLHHFAEQSLYAGDFAKTNQVTRQGKSGAKGGGQKFGEQENALLMAYAAPRLFSEVFKETSDNYTVLGCIGCNIMSTSILPNLCPFCKSINTIRRFEVPYSRIYTEQVALSLGIKLTSKLVSEEDFYSHHANRGKRVQEVSHSEEEEEGEEVEEEIEVEGIYDHLYDEESE